MKLLGIAMAALALTAGAALAQFTTRPSVYGHPEYGTTTTGPGGSWNTSPSVYGHPEYGTTSMGPNGRNCRTQASVYGHPEYGTTTTCN